MIRIALLPLAFVVCAAAPAPVAEGLVAMREKGAVGPLTVRPLAIVEDSRCPSDGLCIWAGRVVLRVAVEGPGIQRTLMLEGHKSFPVPGGALVLTRIEPAKPRGKPLKPSAYRFTFEFKAAKPDL